MNPVVGIEEGEQEKEGRLNVGQKGGKRGGLRLRREISRLDRSRLLEVALELVSAGHAHGCTEEARTVRNLSQIALTLIPEHRLGPGQLANDVGKCVATDMADNL